MSVLHNKNALEKAIKNSNSIKEIIRYLGLSSSGDQYSQVRKWAKYHSLDLPKYMYNRNSTTKISLEDKLVKGKVTNNSRLLKGLVSVNMKKQLCEIEECTQTNIWLGKPLTLHLDHIDGDHSNNLLENLRVLCPSCHQQTETFGSKNIKKDFKKYFCSCGNEKTKISKECITCSKISKLNCISNTDIPWPPIEYILNLINDTSYVQTGKILGVSDNAVRKHLKRLGHTPPTKRRQAQS